MPVMIIEKNIDYYKYHEAINNKSRQFVISEEQLNYPSVNPFAILGHKKSNINRDKPLKTGIRKGVIGNIYFDFDKYNIKPEEQRKLQQIIKTLKSKYSNKIIKVIGYTDWFGTEKYNDELARKRAYQVALHLWKAGLTVKPEGRGKCCYKTTPEKSRRVEIIIEDKKEVK
ncbi:OmpA family protein [Deferribacter autotrophicus]|uniref:OmpA family protein n=1 Tax=Deferribacter autotrophicus TaxID=500465 RepID=A0A5A8F1F8_9BACT|nr:OmpA family protein [Deferribacter autotrophicus]KAA0257522.1 OmpA family protein [Deferribacter autotrophicus]